METLVIVIVGMIVLGLILTVIRLAIRYPIAMIWVLIGAGLFFLFDDECDV